MKRKLAVVIRQADRSSKMSDESSDATIQTTGEPLKNSFTRLIESDELVRATGTEEGKKRAECELADAIFGRELNKARTSVLSRMPFAHVPERASAMPTPDDLLRAGLDLDVLMAGIAGVDETHPVDGAGEAAPTGEPWALTVLNQFRPFIAPTAKVHEEVRVIAQLLKEAADERARRREVVEGHLISFRRAVKDVFGARSRQYQQLRNRIDADGGQPGAPPESAPGSEPAPTTALVPA